MIDFQSLLLSVRRDSDYCIIQGMQHLLMHLYTELFSSRNQQ